MYAFHTYHWRNKIKDTGPVSIHQVIIRLVMYVIGGRGVKVRIEAPGNKSQFSFHEKRFPNVCQTLLYIDGLTSNSNQSGSPNVKSILHLWRDSRPMAYLFPGWTIQLQPRSDPDARVRDKEPPEIALTMQIANKKQCNEAGYEVYK